MFTSLLSLAFLSLALPYTAQASSSHGVSHRRHEAIAAAQNNVTNATEHVLERRGKTYKGAKMTYYAVGLGACGKVNTKNEYIVALNSPMYGGGYPGPNCFRPISITYKGKTLPATIMDECPGCPGDGGLDLSEGLFAALAPLDDGIIYADWHFTDEGGEEPAPEPQPEPTTTKKPWKPTTTWQPWTPDPTTWWEPEPTTSTSKSKKHSSTSTSSSTSSTPEPEPETSTVESTTSSTSTTSSSSSSSSSSSTPAPTPTGPNTLEKLNQAFIGLSEVMIAGAQAA